MRFEELSTFERHVRTDTSRKFLIIVPSDSERKKIIDQTIQLIAEKENDLTPIFLEASLTSDCLLEELQNRPLFGISLIVIDAIDRAKKEIREEIAKAIHSPDLFLVLGASTSKGLQELSRLSLLDLSSEKPWQHEKRILESLAGYVARADKRLQPEAAASLLEQIGLEQGSLEKELEKLICFTGKRREITQEDVALLTCSSSSQSGWEVAKRLVWEDEERGFFLSAVLPFDMTLLPQLTGQIRYHLQMGEQLADPQVEAAIFPHLNPATLEKYQAYAKKTGRPIFQKRLLALNDLEASLKQKSAIDPSLHWDLFIGRWR